MLTFDACDGKHKDLSITASTYANSVGYARPSLEKRLAATYPTGRLPKVEKANVETAHMSGMFPAPLLLPGDELALDPHYPPQSLRSWVNYKERNKVTYDRRIIYLAAPPVVSLEVDFVKSWSEVDSSLPVPATADVLDYLLAFYHGLPVKLLDTRFRFIRWEDPDQVRKQKSGKVNHPAFIGLAYGEECTRIRVRHGTKNQDPAYSHQLNLNDMIDMAIEALPEDAYALVLLLHHDMYEDDEDAFVCGRAYGGSRVAVVSTARYNPSLDESQGIDTSHPWPLSHCVNYIDALCSEELAVSSPRKRTNKKSHPTSATAPIDDLSAILNSNSKAPSALRGAVDAYVSVPAQKSPKYLAGIWLSRLVRTVSHELGHCFAIDHCVYYACVMQGSASLNEDNRQPPYLCPIDLAKVLWATQTTEIDRYKALLLYCERHPHIQMFAAFAAWIRKQLKLITNDVGYVQ